MVGAVRVRSDEEEENIRRISQFTLSLMLCRFTVARVHSLPFPSFPFQLLLFFELEVFYFVKLFESLVCGKAAVTWRLDALKS